MDINVIVQVVIQETLAENSAFVAAKPPVLSLASTHTQPTGVHKSSPSDNLLLKDWDRDLDSLSIFQASIRSWFEIPSFAGVTDFTKTLPGIEHQIFLLCLQLMSGLLPDKVLSIFLYNPAYERDRFRM